MAWRFCSKEDVIGLFPITEAEIRDEWSEMVEGLIKEHLGSPHLGTSEAISNEYHSGNGGPVLRVRKPPILSVESLSVDGALLTPSEFIVEGSYIHLLEGRVFTLGTLNVVISYTSGSVEIEQPVRLAAAAMIVAIINFRKRYGSDGSVKFANLDTKLGKDNANTNLGLAEHLKAIMKKLLRRKYIRVRT